MIPLPSLSLAQSIVEVVATVAFALSGLIEAARKRLDAVGVVVVAGLTAFGGGTLRDVLLDRRPFFWVEHAAWLWVLLGLCVAAMLVLRARHFAPTERAMQWPDALGLGLFTAGGTQVALQAGMPATSGVLDGGMTNFDGAKNPSDVHYPQRRYGPYRIGSRARPSDQHLGAIREE